MNNLQLFNFEETMKRHQERHISSFGKEKNAFMVAREGLYWFYSRKEIHD